MKSFKDGRLRLWGLCTVALSLALLACSCSDQTSLTSPSGTVTVDSYYEASGSGAKTCIITFKITNTGVKKITTSTISYSVKTDKRTYKATNLFQAYVLAGQSIYESTTVTYYDSTESTTSADISVLNSALE